MRRRDLLRAAAMAATLPGIGLGRPRRKDAADAWTFALDGELRWSLAPSGRGEPVVRGGEIAVEFADGATVPLGALAEVRRFRFGGRGEPGGWSVVGSAAGVEVTARFSDGGAATAGAQGEARHLAWPQIAVALRGLDAERPLAALRLLDSARAHVPALLQGAQGHRRTDAPTHRGTDAPTRGRTVLVNGYQSWDAGRVVALGEPGESVGHWQFATLEAGAQGHSRTGAQGGGLGLAFGPDDSGEGRFLIGPSGVRVVSSFGGRLVGAAYPPAVTTLTIVPAPDALDILGELAGDARATPLPADVPAGWCSWYELYGDVTEADVLANLAVARRAFDRRAFRIIQIDDGFQRSAGDWNTNAKFPHGHRWLTDTIHDAGFAAGLWLAPFAVADRSGIPLARPEWLLRDARGEPLVMATRSDWGGRIFALDASQRDVQDHLRDLLRHAVREWGYDYLKLDFLFYGAQGTRAGRWQSGAEAYRAGLRAMREGAGGAYLLGCGAPLQHAVGMFDGMRIGPDVDATWEGVQPAAAAALHRAHLNRRPWHNDPDALVVRAPLSTNEARVWASVVALSGQMLLASDRLERLPTDRIDLLQRTVPVAGVSGRALDLAAPEHGRPPAWILAPVRANWWMLAAVNWGDDPRRMALNLAAHGVVGPLLAYDVWNGARLRDVDGRWSGLVAPRSATVLSLRRRTRAPCVIGTTRHIVQGAVDLEGERWDARRSVLSARAVRLDDRPYTVTIALPAGFRAKACRAEVECRLEAAGTGAPADGSVRLVFPAPAEREISWEVEF